MFQLSFERTLFQGFLTPLYFSGALVIVLVLWVVVALASLIILLVSGWIWRKFVSSWIGRKLVSSLWRLFDGLVKKKDQETPPYLKKPIFFILIPYWGLIIVIALMSILVIAGDLGRQVASDEHKRFKSGKELPIKVVHKDKSKLIAHSIGCSETHCAFLVGEQVKVWPLSDISVIESESSQNKSLIEYLKELLRD